MCQEIRVAAAPVGDVQVQLGSREVGMPEHLLHRAQVGTTLEQVGRERMAQQVRVDALGLETRLPGEAAQDEKGAGAGQRPALRIQEELGAEAPVEMGAA